MPAAADGQLQAGVSAGLDGGDDIGGVEAPCDERGLLVDQAVVDRAGDVVESDIDRIGLLRNTVADEA